LQKELRELLMAWDPIGVGGAPEAADEYDCMIGPLMHQLHDGKSAGDIATWLTTELTDHFGLEPSTDGEGDVAVSLVAWWNNSAAR
jgi:hypothetical protein